jgi:hypothetical protein
MREVAHATASAGMGILIGGIGMNNCIDAQLFVQIVV